MKEIKSVRGSEIQAVPIIVGKDTVYIHTNIHTVDVENLDGSTHLQYEYDETQFNKDEFLVYLYNQLLIAQQYATGVHLDILSGKVGV